MRQPGGNSIYSALGARIWLDRITTLTRVGDDYPLEQLESVMSRIEVIAIAVKARSMSAWGLYEANGVRQWIPHPASGTQDQMTPIVAELPPPLTDCAAFHLASMPPAQHLEWARTVKALGALVSADSMQVEVLGSGSIGQQDTHFAMLHHLDLYLPSAIEATSLMGNNDPEVCAKALIGCGPRVVAIKLGRDGSVVFDKEKGRLLHIPSIGSAVDPTGGGDAYCGGFLAGYLITNDAVAAAVMGTVSASYAIQSVGMASLLAPNAEEASERFSTLLQRVSVGSGYDDGGQGSEATSPPSTSMF